MKIISLLSSLFHRERVITLDEARSLAKECYRNEDLAGAKRWNDYIEILSVSSGRDAAIDRRPTNSAATNPRWQAG